jgi:hypothetical protein
MRMALTIAFVLMLFQGATAQMTPAAPAHGCTSPESRQFDFWVGRWTVTSAAKVHVKVADSVIERLYAGCAIRENWKPLRAADMGGSLSSYVATEKAWRQTWVDASGSRVDFRGGWNGSAMVLIGVWPVPGHARQLTRMTYTVQTDGKIRQRGETSDDRGVNWKPSFDLIYTRVM